MPKHFDESTFHEYLDRELRSGAKAAFEAHLEGCKRCREELAALEALFAQIAQAPEERIEKQLAAPVMAALRQPPQPKLRFGWLVAVEVALAALLLILGWPLLEAQANALDVSQLLGAAQLNLEYPDASAIAASWASLVELVEDFFVEFSASSISIPIESYPTLLVAALFGSAALLWLVGNGVLLRSMNENKTAS